MLYFFFSSRRRHTRLTCDWNSDVCSSDLSYRSSSSEPKPYVTPIEWLPFNRRHIRLRLGRGTTERWRRPDLRKPARYSREIGRASCRERVENAGVAGTEKQKNTRYEGVVA